MPTDCANPLLAQWLKEWMDQAKERNSKGYTVYVLTNVYLGHGLTTIVATRKLINLSLRAPFASTILQRHSSSMDWAPSSATV